MNASVVAERFHRCMKVAGVPQARVRADCLTVSIGLAKSAAGMEDTASQLFRRADDALYEAKRTGRSRTAIADKRSSEPTVDRPVDA